MLAGMEVHVVHIADVLMNQALDNLASDLMGAAELADEGHWTSLMSHETRSD